MKKILMVILLNILILQNTFALEIAKQRDVSQEIYQENNNYPYYDSIKWGYEAWIFSWYSEGLNIGKFMPNNTVTRAEFVAMLFKTLQIQVWLEYDNNCFTDSMPWKWYNKYLCYSKEKGYINGYNNGTFQPNDSIKVSEAYKILTNAFWVSINDNKWGQLDGMLLPNSNKWFYQYYMKWISNGIAYKNSLDSEDDFELNLKRGEMMNLLYQFYLLWNSKEVSDKFLEWYIQKNPEYMYDLMDSESKQLEVSIDRYKEIIKNNPIYIVWKTYKWSIFFNGLNNNLKYIDTNSVNYSRKSVWNIYNVSIKFPTMESETSNIEIAFPTIIDTNNKINVHIDNRHFFESTKMINGSAWTRCQNAKLYSFFGHLLYTNTEKKQFGWCTSGSYEYNIEKEANGTYYYMFKPQKYSGDIFKYYEFK